MTDREQTRRDARGRLAGFDNTWFYSHELDEIHDFARTHNEAECQAELDRLSAVRDSRLAAWKQTQ